MNKTRPLFLVCFLLLAGLFAFNSYADEVTISWWTGTYTGEVSNGVPDGQGTWSDPEGSKYVPGGMEYVGEWKDGKWNGQGTFISSVDRLRYVGEWKDGELWEGKTFSKHGELTEVHSEGTTRPPTNEELEQLAEEKRKEAEPNIRKLAGAFGYKDIKMGMTPNDIGVLGVCESLTEQWTGGAVVKLPIFFGRCYGKRDWQFTFSFYGNKWGEVISTRGLHTISINVGHYSQEFETELFDAVGKKYKFDYGYEQRDVDLYNMGEKKLLALVFQKGMVATVIASSVENQTKTHWLHVEYRDKKQAKAFYEANAPPQGIEKDDF